MKHRVPERSWYVRNRAGRRPRVLVEDDHPALAISDFSLFEQAGFDVAYCSGPERAAQECPLLRGQECGVLAHADAVLHGLDPQQGIVAAIRRRHPGIAVVAKRRHGGGTPEAVPPGCTQLVFGCSVSGQLDALRRALTPEVSGPARRGRPAAGPGPAG